MIKRNFLYDVVLPKVEVIGLAVTVIGFSLKWFLQPGGDFLLLIGLALLAPVYLLLAFEPIKLPDYANSEFSGTESPSFLESEATEGWPLRETIARQLVGLGSAALLSGALFKLLSWSGASVILLTGTAALGIGGLLIASTGRLNRKYVLVFGFGVLMLAVPAETLIRQFHRNDPVLTQLLLYQLHHPHDRAANEAVRQYWQARRKSRL